ncbi:hypothetical protein VOLCADRAFT_120276 [Volvox carteri f. nagariensis]|uniref:Uncharacterized protein n=1 Tax=Volvox carteri f. nagariensis TaxID=3068 RepID=D8TJ07_VOLCA|nr:uncharacterized protein VOLCADRAFT_120276 [Volvox carteri f. nagariensis]EFJ52458.1 hypothetical protein VOLCADRAFT_120276 [Volvox carteri f. nagariensis]|eukprot:XP_002946531.1 hypothetical protein VOLCADRAFT_120276 [Volvox carteri f. nagariensis]
MLRRASLKEPTRPVTPADYGRQLFTTGDPSNRPSTSYSVSGSKSFYPDGAPKLALPKLDTGRPDTAASSTLRRQGSIAEREASRLSSSSGFPGLEATVGAAGPRSRQTTAEAIAALKANMGGDGGEFSFATRPITTGSSSQSQSRGSTSDGPQPPDTSGRASSSSAAIPTSAFHSTTTGTATSSASSHHAQTSPGGGGHLGAEFSYGVYIEGGDGPLLDPRRNDDLPPRPGTSRGRPGSAALSDMDPITERYPGPPPGVQDLGNGAQVLDMSAFAQYSDDEENDFDSGAAGGPSRQPQQRQQPQGAGSKQVEVQQQGSETRQAGPVPGPASPRSGRPPQPPQQVTSAPASVSGSGGAAATAVNGVPAAGLEADLEFLAWRSSVEVVLTDLTASISGKAGSSALCGHAGKLGTLVEDARRREHSSRWLKSPSTAFRDAGGAQLSLRDAISEHAFRLMDSSNSELLMKACAVVLRVVKNRQPLLQTAKLLYRLSKDGSNDALFRREGLLEPLVHTVHIMVASVRGSHNPGNMHEPLVYMNGCLKNISNEAHNQKGLVKLGTLHVLAALLTQMADQAKSGDEGLAESCGQVAVQAAGVLPALRAACSALSGQVEVVLNAGRILSKLSLHEGCQAAIAADPAYAPLLIQLLGQYADNRAILLRVAFVLGNLTTTSNEYREQVCNVPFALVTVVGILQRYAFGGPGGEGGSAGSTASDRLSRAASHEDCLVKVLRLAANLAIWSDAGHTLAEEAHVADALLHLLEAYSFEAAEELVLNTVCALTNLSYYQSDTTPGGFTNKVLQLPPARLMPRITPLLMCDNEEAVIEAARVYGNFSRSPEVRDYMQAARVVEALVLLLDHSNAEVLYSVCGTLINFTMDASRKHVLGALGGTSRLVEVLSRTVAQDELGDRDEAIIDVVCKALFNVASADDGVGRAGSGVNSASSQGSGSAGQALENSAVAESEEMASVLGRLAVQMRRLQQRMVSSDLEALPE